MTDNLDEAGDNPRRRQRGKLEHPVTKLRLIRELADGSKTQTELAMEFGCGQPAVSMFAARHAAAIADVRANMDDEFAGILYASKAARLAAYDEDVEDPDASLQDRHRALKSIAEELGHLANRVTMGGEVAAKVTFEVSGLDPGALT